MARRTPHNKGVTGVRSSVSAFEITPFGRELADAREGTRRWKLLAKKRAELLQVAKSELISVALLASEKAEFFNPMHVAKAKQIRDRVLAEFRSA